MLRPGEPEQQLPGDSRGLSATFYLPPRQVKLLTLLVLCAWRRTFPAISGFSHTDEEFLHAEAPIFLELLQRESGIPVLDRFDDLLMLMN